MIIVADIGNSGIRLGASDSPDPRATLKWRVTLRAPADYARVAEKIGPAPARWLVASVHVPRCNALRDWLEASRPGDSLRAVSWQDVPLAIAVEHPDRLGIDRLVAGWAAWRNQEQTQRSAVIVVDAGTAVTVDLVSRAGQFEGGNIFPGARACLDWLAQSTDQLPDVAVAELPAEPLGRNTVDAMLSGVMRLQAGGIARLVDELRQLSGEPELPVWLTGGGIAGLRPLLPDDWHFDRDLILNGLLVLARQLA